MARIRIDRIGQREHPLEATIQMTVMSWVRLNKLDHIVWHTPNGGSMTSARGEKLRRLGVLSGVSDLIVARQSRGYGAMFLELKALKGRLSPRQKEFLEAMKFEGYCIKVAHSIDEAIDAIKWYLQM